jgi:hypothetical protein
VTCVGIDDLRDLLVCAGLLSLQKPGAYRHRQIDKNVIAVLRLRHATSPVTIMVR